MQQQETQNRSFRKCSLLLSPRWVCCIESSLECKQIYVLKFLNKYYLLWLKYFFKERFDREIELILQKNASIMRTTGINVVLTHVNKKWMLITASLSHLFFDNLCLL